MRTRGSRPAQAQWSPKPLPPDQRMYDPSASSSSSSSVALALARSLPLASSAPGHVPSCQSTAPITISLSCFSLRTRAPLLTFSARLRLRRQSPASDGEAMCQVIGPLPASRFGHLRGPFITFAYLLCLQLVVLQHQAVIHYLSWPPAPPIPTPTALRKPGIFVWGRCPAGFIARLRGRVLVEGSRLPCSDTVSACNANSRE